MEHKSWYFFRRFKMMLFRQQGLGRNILLEDASGKKLSAHTVFALSIKYLKEDLQKMSEKRFTGSALKEDDIHWVLTVPAIWDDAAKQFMREAAQEAGISGDKLTIALEPEAASIYCRHLPVEKCGNVQSLSTFGAGKRYLVLDAGGGTVDITVHEVLSAGRLKEVFKASGGAWGGTKVDDAFYEFLSVIAGKDVMPQFRQQHFEDYIELFRDFEVKKRDIDRENDAVVTIRIPTALTDLVKDTKGLKIQDIITQTDYSAKVKLVGDKLRIDSKVVQQFFEPSVKSVIAHLRTLMHEPVNRGIEAVVMVGGFSESAMLQEAIQSEFRDLKIIVPNEAGLAVLKGAVIFGHNPATISERVSKFTYGTDILESFDHDKHPVEKITLTAKGRKKCNDVFSKLVECGQTLVVGEAQDEHSFTTANKYQTSMGMDIYATLERNPAFIDDPGCHKIGTFSVPVSGRGASREVRVKMIFGGTEIDVECKDVATGKVSHLKVDFLS